jgi:hypothetical protein
LVTVAHADSRWKGVRKHGSPGSADMIQFIGGLISMILLDF